MYQALPEKIGQGAAPISGLFRTYTVMGACSFALKLKGLCVGVVRQLLGCIIGKIACIRMRTRVGMCHVRACTRTCMIQ